jgi:hypothetical protein
LHKQKTGNKSSAALKEDKCPHSNFRCGHGEKVQRGVTKTEQRISSRDITRVMSTLLYPGVRVLHTDAQQDFRGELLQL